MPYLRLVGGRRGRPRPTHAEFVKTFEAAYERDLGGREQVLALRDSQMLVERLTQFIEAFYPVYRWAHAGASRDEYKLFWIVQFGPELVHLKRLQAGDGLPVGWEVRI